MFHHDSTVVPFSVKLANISHLRSPKVIGRGNKCVGSVLLNGLRVKSVKNKGMKVHFVEYTQRHSLAAPEENTRANSKARGCMLILPGDRGWKCTEF